MRTELRHIDVFSAIRVGTPLGLLFGIIALLPNLFDYMASRTPAQFLIDGLLVFAGIVVIAALFSGMLAIAYNRIAQHLGGIEFTTTEQPNQ